MRKEIKILQGQTISGITNNSPVPVYVSVGDETVRIVCKKKKGKNVEATVTYMETN